MILFVLEGQPETFVLVVDNVNSGLHKKIGPSDN
uniref:Transposase n=1 Tax=Heterorhabditis bacteriophora TaxID=37862 RepID=A0A1I7WS92_HETBA